MENEFKFKGYYNLEYFKESYPRGSIESIIIYIAKERLNGIPTVGIRYDVDDGKGISRGIILFDEILDISGYSIKSGTLSTACNLIDEVKEYYGDKANPDGLFDIFAENYGK